MDVMQSAYLSLHSAEAVLLKVQTTVLSTLNDASDVVLLMLDFSVTFGAIDHQIFLSCLHDMYGINDDLYALFNS